MSDDEQRNDEQEEGAPEREPVKITPNGVTNRPELRARSRETEPQEGGGEDLPELSREQGAKGGKPVRKVSLPSQAGLNDRLAYATHRSAPGDERKQPQQAQPEAPAPAEGEAAEEDEREMSAAFVLGILILVIALIFGFLLARVNARVSRLERTVQELQEPGGAAGE